MYLAESFDGGLFIGPHFVHRFDVGAHVAAHGIGMFLDEFPRGGSAGVLKHQAHLRDVGDDGKSAFFRDEARRRIDDGSRYPAGQQSFQALWTASDLNDSDVLTSGQARSFFSAKRAMVSVAEPKRLMAKEPPLSCSTLLTPGLPIST